SSSNNSINLEDIKVTSYKSDGENSSTDKDENIDIPKPMKTDQTYQDLNGKRKSDYDTLEDDYLRSFNRNCFNRNCEQVENTTRMFGN
ncbi:hypothetical protein Godav_004204, partial [Gossypium davidsonii]|nr:hypothetical protein [Gossypium davidsonii]